MALRMEEKAKGKLLLEKNANLQMEKDSQN
jgi:hypothetical protein